MTFCRSSLVLAWLCLVTAFLSGCESIPPNFPANSSGSVTSGGVSEVKTALVQLRKRSPARAALGQEYVNTLEITAVRCVGNVVVVDQIPAGAALVRTEPPAEVTSNTITWKLGDLEANQSLVLKAWLKAERDGSLVANATIAADPRTCATNPVAPPAPVNLPVPTAPSVPPVPPVATRAEPPRVATNPVVRPVLSLDLQGPATAWVGAKVTYQCEVQNNSSVAARAVVVSDLPPDGLSGPPVMLNVGDLAPGEAKTVTAIFKADQRGKTCNAVTVTASNLAQAATAECCTLVQQSGLSLATTGDPEQIIGLNATYNLTVANVGDTEIHNIELIDQAPAGTEIAEAPEATINRGQATWDIPAMLGGEQRTFTLQLLGKTAGEHVNHATLKAGNFSQRAKVRTVWHAGLGLSLELRGDPQAIKVGDLVTFTMQVTNPGLTALHDLGLTVACGAGLVPQTAPTGTVNGQTVNFPLLSELPPKQTVTYVFTAKGKAAGDQRTRATLTGEEIKLPITKVVGTTVE